MEKTMNTQSNASESLTCPLCDVDIPLSGEEVVGQQIMCVYCECPLKLKKTRDDELYLVEDF
ncbi:MAG: hypothetical protein GQ522_00890 [Deltaproteobacteria bacterium]|jgi:hypothetical protein|nr:hypothetical protein [Deltaproteobacteria bacterium]